MRKPDVGPLGLTRGDARARAMVAASRVNRPGGGAVETVVTVATQRRRRPCRARRRDRVRRGRLSILVLSPGSLDQRPSRWPRRARPHPAEPWLRGAREVSEGQRCPTEAPEGHWLWPALPDRHPQPELRAAYGPPSVSAPVLALTGAGAGPVPGLQAVRRLDSDATPGAPSPACRRTGTRVAPPGLERAGPDALDEHTDVLPVSRAMKNFEAARQFELMADLLEIRGDNPVRIRAYRRAALNPRVSPGPPGRAAAPRRAWGCPRGLHCHTKASAGHATVEGRSQGLWRPSERRFRNQVSSGTSVRPRSRRIIRRVRDRRKGHRASGRSRNSRAM